MATATLTRTMLQRGSETVLARVSLWHVDITGNPQVFRWSGIALADSAARGGYAEARVLTIGANVRELSDWQRQMAGGSTWTITLNDTPDPITKKCLLRGWMGNGWQQVLQNRQIVVEMTTDRDRRAGNDWIVVARALVLGVKTDPSRPFSFLITCQSPIANRYQRQVPSRMVSADFFPGVVPAAAGQVEPFLYGDSTRIGQSTATTAPSYSNPMGTGDRTASITVTVGDGISGPGGGWLVNTTSQDLVNGVDNDGPIVIFAGFGDTGQYIQFDFPSPQLIVEAQLVAADVIAEQGMWKWQGSNDSGATWTDIGPIFNLTTPGGGSFPATFTFTSLAGNTTAYKSYRLISSPADPHQVGFWSEFKFATTGDVVGSTGQWPALYIGAITDTPIPGWGAGAVLLINSHACKSVSHAYLIKRATGTTPVNCDSLIGSQLLIPGGTGWSTYVGPVNYVDITSPSGETRRYALAYAKGALAEDLLAGPDGVTASAGNRPGALLTLDVQGIETNGDCTGTLVDEASAVYLDLLCNYVLDHPQWTGVPPSGYLSGPRLGVPTYNDGGQLINSASFSAASAAATAAYGQMIRLVVGVRTAKRAQDIIAMANQSADVESGVSAAGAFVVSPMSLFESPSESVNDVVDLLTAGFGIEDKPDELANSLSADLDEFYLTGTKTNGSTVAVTDSDSQLSYGRFDAPALSLAWVRDPNLAKLMLASDLARRSQPPRYVTLRRGLDAVIRELGDVINVTAIEGFGATGWSVEPVQVRSISPDLSPGVVTLVCRHVRPILPKLLLEDLMSERDLGGSRENGVAPNPDGDRQAVEFRRALVPWSRTPAGYKWQIYVTTTVASGGIVTPKLKNFTDSVYDVTCSIVNSTTIIEAIDLPVKTVDKEYELWVNLSGCSALVATCFAKLRMVPV